MEIVLIRHGKPTSANNPIVDASEYTQWFRRYNFSDVSDCSRPDNINLQFRSFYVVSSDLKRAIHSANIYVGKPPEEIDGLLREMDIPRYKLPIRLRAWSWIYLSRFLWMMRFKGSFESFNNAKKRAD